MALNLRNTLFWKLDSFKGNPVAKHLDEVQSINDSEAEIIAQYQNEKIRGIISYANENVPFYRKSNYRFLEDFPVVNKMDYKNDLESYCSTKFKKEELNRVVTSGSTGTPFVSYQDKNKKYRNTADALYFANLAGYNFGELLYYLKIWSKNNRKSKLTQYMQNIVPVDAIDLSGGKVEEFIIDLNNRTTNIHLNSYASTLEEICKYLDQPISKKVNSNSKIKSIIAQSEALMDETKERLEKYFHCQPCSRYSNVENGIVAQQTKTSNSLFKVNSASYKIEILKLDRDEPANKGELGRLVVTDLFNYAMPFIRYDTGDIARFKLNEAGELNFNFIVEIEGRKLDLLMNTNGEIISSFIMYKNMFQYPEIDQYQLIQEGKKNYSFVISIKKKFNKEAKLKNEFLTFLGEDAEFNISYVNEIPLLSSGKRRKIVNNYIKNLNN